MQYVFLVLIPTLIISGAVQLHLKSTYGKWRQVSNSSGATGGEVGEALFARTSLKPIPLRQTKGELTDNFDPRAGVVNLSQAVGVVQPRWRRWPSSRMSSARTTASGTLGLMALRNSSCPSSSARGSPTS
jgi:hypothetical protein